MIMEYKLYKSKTTPVYLTQTSTTVSSYYILANQHGTLWFNRKTAEILYLPSKYFLVLIINFNYLR